MTKASEELVLASAEFIAATEALHVTHNSTQVHPELSKPGMLAGAAMTDHCAWQCHVLMPVPANEGLGRPSGWTSVHFDAKTRYAAAESRLRRAMDAVESENRGDWRKGIVEDDYGQADRAVADREAVMDGYSVTPTAEDLPWETDEHGKIIPPQAGPVEFPDELVEKINALKANFSPEFNAETDRQVALAKAVRESRDARPGMKVREAMEEPEQNIADAHNPSAER